MTRRPYAHGKLKKVEPNHTPSKPPSSPAEPTILQNILSVLAAFFGVQSRKNRERDFQKANPMRMIALALIFVFVLVLGLMILVKNMLAEYGL